ncbi:hypothetical protein G6F43_006985 [Rhizopus delemar]|nr:hypothetical protein G6F43_006985 [Rhizopus delemar]
MMTEDNNVGPLATPTRFLIENDAWNFTPGFGQEITVDPFDCNYQPQTRSPMITREDTWLPEPALSPSTPPLTQSPTNSFMSLSNSMDDIIGQEEATQRTTSKKERDEEYKPRSTGGRKRRIVFEGEDAEERRKKFLERNRVAAYKCRQKKKSWIQELEQRAEICSARNKELRQIVSQLKEESMYLRNLLLSHGNCDCESVQSYLRRTSMQITSNVYSRRESSQAVQPNYSTSFKDNTNHSLNTIQAQDYFTQTHSMI